MSNMDRLFMRFVGGLFILMILYGCGMIIVILVADVSVGLRMVNAFASMFVGMLGLGSGYILGRKDPPSNEERRPHDPT